MLNAFTILKDDPSIAKHLDFKQLRKEGLKHISKLSGGVWTDHNLHDPGITIFEVLMYAIMDLGYRCQLSTKDILALNKGLGQEEDNFYTPAEILSCNPLTVTDYRKLLIDIDGVRNAWLEPADQQEVPVYINCEENKLQFNEIADKKLVLNGLYKIYLELDINRPQDRTSGACGDDELSVDRILNEVKSKLSSHRNLCEDFLDIIVLRDEEISLCSDIELMPDANPEATLVKIYQKIQEFLSPAVNFYTLEELLKKGKTTDEIFEGRPLTYNSHGFIDTNELNDLRRIREIHSSDIYSVIMAVPGVRAVKKLLLYNFIGDQPQSINGQAWCLKLTDLHRPLFSLAKSTIRFTKGVLTFLIDPEKIEAAYYNRLIDYKKAKISKDKLDLPIPEGTYRKDLDNHITIQKEFPLTYRIGEGELTQDSLAIRKTQSRQLRAYLLFFDQLFANYLVQLSNIRNIFSLRSDTIRDESSRKTYFSNKVEGVAEIDKLIRFYTEPDSQQNMATLASQGSPAPYSTAVERDMEVRKTILAFENKTIKIELAENAGIYSFNIEDLSGNVLLISTEQFDSASNAQKQADIIRFLGKSEACYKSINDNENQEFSFELIYNPTCYIDYLNEITENESKYLYRRDRFLNHLLARFGEHFTEYVLLMYALNEDGYTPEKIIHDKANYLTSYPSLSRNRGQAYNIKDSINLWDSDNISGFEKKITKMMGIESWKRSNLCNFDVVKRDALYYFEYKDHRGNVLFISYEGYANEDSALEAFSIFLDLLKNNYSCEEWSTFDCEVDKQFGFYIKDNNGIPIARHPYSYSKNDIRDQKLECICQLIKGEGKILKITPSESGFYFLLYNDDQDKVLLKSPSPFPSYEEALEAWYNFLNYASDEQFYFETEDPLGKGYSFIVGVKNETGGMDTIALHPEYYTTKSQRTKQKNKVINYISSKNLNYQIQQQPDKYFWNYREETGNLLLKSIQFFKTVDQTACSWIKFLPFGSDPANYEDITEDGKLAFCINKTNGLKIAQSDWYETQNQLDAARLKIQAKLSASGMMPEFISSNETGYGYLILNENEIPLIKSTKLYGNWSLANIASKELTEKTNSIHTLIREFHPGKFQIEFLDKTSQVIAISIESFTTAKKAESGLQHILLWLQQHPFPKEYNQQNCYGIIIRNSKDVFLKGNQIYRHWQDAYRAFTDLVQTSSEITHFQKFHHHVNGYGFHLKNETGEILAFHPKYYDHARERDEMLNETFSFIKEIIIPLIIEKKPKNYRFNLLNHTEEIILNGQKEFENQKLTRNAFFDFLKIAVNEENYFPKVSPDGCRYSFEIKNSTNAVLATHPYFYLTEDEKDLAQAEIIDYIRKNMIWFWIRKEEGKFQFELNWISCKDKCATLLKGMDEYETREKAEEAFHIIWQKLKDNIIHLEENTDQLKYSFSAKEGDVVIAEHPAYYSNIERRDNVLTDARNFVAFNDWGMPTILTDIKIKKDCDKEDDETIDNLSGFRLINKNEIFAVHPEIYRSASKRDEVLDNFFSTYKKSGSPHTEIQLSNNIVEDQGYFRFAITKKSDKSTLWLSINTYESETEAINAFKEQYINILTFAAKRDHYQLSENKKTIYLYSDKDKKIAFCLLPENTPDRSLLFNDVDPVKERISFAIRYPVISGDEGYRFQLRDFDSTQIFWKSSQSYTSPDLTRQAFRNFLSLLENKDNYRKKDNPCARIFEFELGEVMLESRTSYLEENDITQSISNIEAAWEGLKDFLQIPADERTFLAFINHQESCKYGFQIVGKGYHMARHPVYFNTTQERENERDKLFGFTQCPGQLYTEVFPDFCEKRDQIYFILKDESGNSLWKSIEGYIDIDSAREAYDQQFVRILGYGSEADFYSVLLDENGKFRIYLTDESGRQVMETPNVFDTEESLKEAILTRILFACMFPYRWLEDKIAFHLYLKDYDQTKKAEICVQSGELEKKLIIEIPGCIGWQSILSYPVKNLECEEEYDYVKNEFGKFLELIKDKSNYHSPYDPECGPFSLEIVDPDQILATHPRSYERSAEMEQAMAKARASLNSEGFHLVEHILLRPQNGSESGYMVTVTTNDNSNVFISDQLFTDKMSASRYKRNLVAQLASAIKKSGIETKSVPDWKDVILNKDSSIISEGLDLLMEIFETSNPEKHIEYQLAPLLGIKSMEEENPMDTLMSICSECEDETIVSLGNTSNECISPTENTISYIPGADPYSFWITIIMPYWPERFQNTNFRAFFENTLRREIPAHIALRIAWIDPKQMCEFEIKYKNWLEVLSGENNCNLYKARNNIVHSLLALKNIYPPASLSKCKGFGERELMAIGQIKLG